MAETINTRTMPTATSATDHWPANAVEAPPPTRKPQFPDTVLRSVISALKLHGDNHAARVLKKSYPILDLQTCRNFVETVFKPKAVAIARELARREAAGWQWEGDWQARLLASSRGARARARQEQAHA